MAQVIRTLLFTLVASALSLPAFAGPLKVQGQEFMPFNGTENGKLGGAFQKITELACKKAGQECVFEVVPLNRSLKMLEDGESHMVLGIAPNAERKKIADFPDPLTTTGYTFIVKKGQAGKYSKIDDFKGKTVAVYGPSATQTSAEKVNKDLGGALKLVTESTSPEIPYRKLDGGRYGDDAAVYASRPVTLYFAKTQKADIEPVSFDAVKTVHGVGIGKKGVDEATRKKLVDAFNDVVKSPEGKKILAEYDLHPWDGK